MRAWVFPEEKGWAFWVLGSRWAAARVALGEVKDVAFKGQCAGNACDEAQGEGSEGF